MRKKQRLADIEENLNILALGGKVEALGDGQFTMTDAGNSAAEALIRAWGVDPNDPDALQQLKAKGFFGTQDKKG